MGEMMPHLNDDEDGQPKLEQEPKGVVRPKCHHAPLLSPTRHTSAGSPTVPSQSSRPFKPGHPPQTTTVSETIPPKLLPQQALCPLAAALFGLPGQRVGHQRLKCRFPSQRLIDGEPAGIAPPRRPHAATGRQAGPYTHRPP